MPYSASFAPRSRLLLFVGSSTTCIIHDLENIACSCLGLCRALFWSIRHQLHCKAR